ncbi:MAG: histidine kinase [Methylococcales bacterium]|nr:histidine kinase [Methylococcales bacterium]
MSLRYQISIRIFLISLCVLLVGGSVSIWQARQSVSDEVDSSINLALQLIKIGIGTTRIHQTDWIFRLNSLDQTRHLSIQIKKPTGEVIKISRQTNVERQDETPPTWFINLVVSEYPRAEHQIKTSNNNVLTLIIQANPMDEIIEVWGESVSFFSTLLLLILLTFLAVHLVFNKTLRVIQSILNHLKTIEEGEFRKKLPFFATQEYDDIATAINQMTDVLDRTQQQNRALTQHSLEIQEEERRWLSQELHDEFGQSFTAIKVMAVTAAHEKSDTKQITDSIIDICNHLMTVVRSMMKQLHPLILTELGLKATLEDLLDQWEARNAPTTFSLHCVDEIDALDKTIIIQVFRVIQESITNIIRHAQANHVTISLDIHTHPDRLNLIITDDGRGCDLNRVASGFGLLGMEERVKLLNGDFTIESQINKGMTINAQIPL